MSEPEVRTASDALTAAKAAVLEVESRTPEGSQERKPTDDAGPKWQQHDGPTFGSDEDGLRRATAWRRRQLEGEPAAPRDTYDLPIVEHEVGADLAKHLETATSHQALRETSKAISDNKKLREYQKFYGDRATLPEIEKVEDWTKDVAEKHGLHVPLHPSKGMDVQIPIMIGGQIVERIPDDRPVGPGDEMTRAEMRRSMREVREAERNLWLQQFGVRVQEAQPEVQAAEQPASAPEHTPQPPAQPAVDPLLAEKQRYQAWTNYAANVARSSERELLLAAQIRAIDEHAMAHPEMRDQRAFDAMYTRNPERIAEWQQVRAERDALAREYQQEGANRESREREVTARQNAQRQAPRC